MKESDIKIGIKVRTIYLNNFPNGTVIKIDKDTRNSVPNLVEFPIGRSPVWFAAEELIYDKS